MEKQLSRMEIEEGKKKVSLLGSREKSVIDDMECSYLNSRKYVLLKILLEREGASEKNKRKVML